MKLKSLVRTLIVSPLLLLAVHAQADDRLDLVDTAVKAGSFNTLVTLVQKAGLVETLKGPGPFTVFAPTDAAFAKLPKALVDRLVADPKLLKTVLTYHVLAGEVSGKEAFEIATKTDRGGTAKTVSGQKIILNARGRMPVLFVNNSKVIAADVLATNGVIHVIDRVLMPKLPFCF